MGTVKSCVPTADDSKENEKSRNKGQDELDAAELKGDKFMKDERFRSLDLYSKVMVLYSSKLEGTGDEVKMNDPSILSEDFTEQIVPEIGKLVANSDEESDKMDQLRYLETISSKVKSNFLPGYKDQFKRFKSAQDGIDFRCKYFDNLPKTNVEYDYKHKCNSDKTVSKFAFSGMGAHYLKKTSDSTKCPDDTAVFESDFSAISLFNVRDKFERYGAVAYFDKNTTLIGIYCCYKSKYISASDGDTESSAEWEHVKYVYKTSVVATVTVIDHLHRTHYTESNALLSSNIEAFPLQHPLRCFIKPFVFNASGINYAAYTALSNTQGLVHRMWAFPYDQIVKIFNWATMNYKFRLLTDVVDASMMDVDDKYFGFNKDCNEFWEIMRKYVADFVCVYYKTDDDLFNDKCVVNLIGYLCVRLNVAIKNRNEFIDVLAQLFCNSTAFHEHVGHISDYVLSPEFFGTRVEENHQRAGIQEYALTLSLVAMTGVRNPSIYYDWRYLFVKDDNHKQVMAIYNEWQQNLKRLEKNIEERNKERVYPIQSFNPSRLECSVSV